MTKYPKISIIFPNYNGGKEPLECLSSIELLNYPKNKVEIIVIDNGSKDGSDIQIKKRFPKVNLIKNKQNLGFARAVNMGIKKATGVYIFIGNDDLVFEKDSLKKLVEYALKYNGVGILGGKIYYKYLPNKIASAGYHLNVWTGNIYPSRETRKLSGSDWIQGCAMLISRAVFKKIGLFDSAFTHLFEDVDFCFRARKANFKVIYVPQAKFWHAESLTADKNKSLKYLNWYKGKLRFIIKNMPFINITSIIMVQTFLVIPFRALFLRDGRLIPFIKGLAWNIKNLQKTLALRVKNYEPNIS